MVSKSSFDPRYVSFTHSGGVRSRWSYIIELEAKKGMKRAVQRRSEKGRNWLGWTGKGMDGKGENGNEWRGKGRRRNDD